MTQYLSGGGDGGGRRVSEGAQAPTVAWHGLEGAGMSFRWVVGAPQQVSGGGTLEGQHRGPQDPAGRGWKGEGGPSGGMRGVISVVTLGARHAGRAARIWPEPQDRTQTQ